MPTKRQRTLVSEYYDLGRKQPELDFVDVDIQGDTPVFIDPRALRHMPHAWGHECVSLVQNFFGKVISDIRSGNTTNAQRLLRNLREPNETHLGLSTGKARGHAVGERYAFDLTEALSRSAAVRSGLLHDLEDAALLVEGIDIDVVSDITTNIIRPKLIEYTEAACDTYGIPMQLAVSSGALWDPVAESWQPSVYVKLPVTTHGRLLLVPKVIVRRKLELDASEYLRDYVLEFLVEQELRAGSELVQLLKDGRQRVTKKDVKKKHGEGKALIAKVTVDHPEVLARYRAAKDERPQAPLSQEDFATLEETDGPDWEQMWREMRNIPAGKESAGEYHRKAERLLSSLFYPSLTSPKIETYLHEGRKRVDISYLNNASDGFFAWLSRNYRCPYLFVECKNYEADPSNPELDQLSSRFSPNRGNVGLLVCRTIADRSLFTQRCRDTANDSRGFVLALDDEDLGELARLRAQQNFSAIEEWLRARFVLLIH